MNGRARPALLFAMAGLCAAALHVAVETPGALRDWRQTLPLAAVVGAGLGAAARPCGWRAGLVWTAAGVVAFAAVFAIGHAMIDRRWDDAARAFGASLASTGALAAMPLGALAGWLSPSRA